MELPSRLIEIPCILNSDVHNYSTRASNATHRTRCHNRSLQALLQTGLDKIPDEMSQLIELSLDEVTIRLIIRKFKSITLANYSDVEICQNRNCYSCK